QRAEYLADYLATQVSGTDAMLSGLKKVHFSDSFGLMVQKVALDRSRPNLFHRFQHQMAGTPPRELDRIERVDHLETSRLDVTHPPTACRTEFLKAHRIAEPRFSLTPDDFDALAAELEPYQAAIQQQLTERYLRGLYY